MRTCWRREPVSCTGVWFPAQPQSGRVGAHLPVTGRPDEESLWALGRGQGGAGQVTAGYLLQSVDKTVGRVT